MLTTPSRAWSVFQQIFAEHWEAFQHAHPRYQTPYYNGLVAKMFACGHPEKIGYTEYRCLHCGQGKHLVAMSCKSSLCLRCAKVSVDNWVNQVSKMLHEGVIYRHIILTTTGTPCKAAVTHTSVARILSGIGGSRQALGPGR
jgi:hypothetical protein